MSRLYTGDVGYDTPDLDLDELHVNHLRDNAAFFFKPTQHRKISLQALRSNKFNFSDRFNNEAADFLSKATTGGTNEGLNKLLRSQSALDSVNVSSDIDGFVDLNRLNDYWRFIIVLNRFQNKRLAGGTSHTAIITGRCVEEPVLQHGGRTRYNPDCELIIEGKTIFQTYDGSAFSGSYDKKNKTKSSRGWGYGELFEQAHDDVMYENTPGGMNHTPDVSSYDGSLRLGSDPVSVVGQNGPSQFDRKQQLPGQMLAKTMYAINKTCRETEQRRILPIDDFETSLSVDESPLQYSSLVDNIRQAERSNMYTQDQFGPSVNNVVRAPSLETEYGVTNVKICKQDQLQFWTGSDQTEITTRGMFESILATQLPSMMVESQIHSISFEAEGYSDSYGNDVFNFYVHRAVPSLVSITTEQLNAKIDAMKVVLENGIFRQIRETVGDFSLGAKINVTSISSLSLHFLDDGPADDHSHEFSPFDFTMTTPMIGNEEVVRHNQSELGNFLSTVCQINSDVYDPGDTSNWDVAPPRPRGRIGTSDEFLHGVNSNEYSDSDAFDW